MNINNMILYFIIPSMLLFIMLFFVISYLALRKSSKAAKEIEKPLNELAEVNKGISEDVCEIKKHMLSLVPQVELIYNKKLEQLPEPMTIEKIADIFNKNEIKHEILIDGEEKAIATGFISDDFKVGIIIGLSAENKLLIFESFALIINSDISNNVKFLNYINKLNQKSLGTNIFKVVNKNTVIFINYAYPVEKSNIHDDVIMKTIYALVEIHSSIKEYLVVENIDYKEFSIADYREQFISG